MYSYLFYHFFLISLSIFMNFELFLFDQYFCENIHQYIRVYQYFKPLLYLANQT